MTSFIDPYHRRCVRLINFWNSCWKPGVTNFALLAISSKTIRSTYLAVIHLTSNLFMDRLWVHFGYIWYSPSSHYYVIHNSTLCLVQNFMSELIDGNIKFSDAYIGLLIGLLSITLSFVLWKFVNWWNTSLVI
jgi:hypothetical protein